MKNFVPKKSWGTLKGPKESSANSELLNFSLASGGFWLFFACEGIYEISTLHRPLAVCYGSQTQGNLPNCCRIFLKFSLSIMTHQCSPLLFGMSSHQVYEALTFRAASLSSSWLCLDSGHFFKRCISGFLSNPHAPMLSM